MFLWFSNRAGVLFWVYPSGFLLRGHPVVFVVCVSVLWLDCF